MGKKIQEVDGIRNAHGTCRQDSEHTKN